MKNLKSLIIWASTSSPSLKENDDGTYPSWIKPVIKLIKKAYHTFPNLKIMGVQLGSHLLSIALGGSVEKT
jgi:GMP synthase-like glutamine amidotransferase